MKKHAKSRRTKPRKPSAKRQQASKQPHSGAGSTVVAGKTRATAKAATSSSTYGRQPRGPSDVLMVARTARDDRYTLALLLAPFLIVALSLMAERTARQILARAPVERLEPRSIASPAPHDQPSPVSESAQPAPFEPSAIPAAPQLAASASIAHPPLPLSPLTPLEKPSTGLPILALIELPPAPLPELALVDLPPHTLSLLELPPRPLPALALIELPQAPLPELALIDLPLHTLSLLELPPAPLPALSPVDVSPLELARTMAPSLAQAPLCMAQPWQQPSAPAFTPADSSSLGLAIAAAARAQTTSFVIYNPKYQRIAYPMGDVAPLFGVCTDVLIRAYRAVGIDLQALIQETGSGRGDRNIDHRRVEVIRGFLARHGQTLPISDLSEDYQPGDIVTYHRPQNRTSTSHIAIVSDVLAPSGRPMIVHNRGWGPEMEDALFVDRITGHYRFGGLSAATKPEPSSPKRRFARVTAARP